MQVIRACRLIDSNGSLLLGNVELKVYWFISWVLRVFHLNFIELKGKIQSYSYVVIESMDKPDE